MGSSFHESRSRAALVEAAGQRAFGILANVGETQSNETATVATESAQRNGGARIVEQLPDVGGGAFGVARMAALLHQRLTPSQGERPGRPTNPTWVSRPKVPMSKATAQKLQKLATALSTPRRKVSPMQIAAQLLEEALARVE